MGMSLTNCPISDLCPVYENGTPIRDHYTRLTHPCNEFLSGRCEIGQNTEMFIRINLGEEISCSIDKGKEYREKK